MKPVKYVIQKTTCLVNGRFYIGLQGCYDLAATHFGSGHYLQRDIRKYGKAKFRKEILHVFDCLEAARKKHGAIVTQALVARRDCYNARIGGCPLGGYQKGDTARPWTAAMKANHAAGMQASKERQRAGMRAAWRVDRERRDNLVRHMRAWWASPEGQAKRRAMAEGMRGDRRAALLWRARGPDGTVYENIENLGAFCAEHGLRYRTLHQTVTRGRPTTRGPNLGWMLV